MFGVLRKPINMGIRYRDRISNLPDDITQRILGRLPIRDTVRTSILSRTWRHKWTTLPQLVFEVPPFSPQLQNNEDKLVDTISGILFQHKGPISKFSLSLSVKTMTSYAKVDQWLQFLSNTGAITEFTLEFIDGSRYKIHSSLFSCASLRRLKLGRCIIPSRAPPTIFNGLNNLTCLELESVSFSNEGCENLIAKCPQLSSLRLCFVDGVDRLNIHHAPKLETLYFCANLIKQISLNYTPSLVSASLYSSQLSDMNQNLGNGESTSLINNLYCISNFRTIVLGHYFLKFLAQDRVKMQLPSTFDFLWHVHFYELMFEDMDSVSSALRLTTSSPNLRKLVVTARTNQFAAQLKTVTEYLEVRSGSIGSWTQLKYVEMNNINGSGPEMQFIKMILGNSPLLKQMKIQHDQSNVCRDRESKILKELIRFPRASSIAEIIY